MSNHELLASSPPRQQAIAVPQTATSRRNGRATNGSTNGSRGLTVDDDHFGTRAGEPGMRLARLPTEPVRPEPSPREIQQALRREECATAVADRERIAAGLYDTVIHRLFAAGLQLQATCQVVDGPARLRIEGTIDLLDKTISELRKAIFSLR